MGSSYYPYLRIPKMRIKSMWILVFLVSHSGSVTTDHINGFATQQSCMTAGSQLYAEFSKPISIKWKCIKQ